MSASPDISWLPWPRPGLFPYATLLALLALVAGCQRNDSAGPDGGSRVVNVRVAKARLQPVSETLALVGSLAADEMVQILSEIDGTVESIHFEEGQKVNEGDLLIQLDQTKLAATLAESEANYTLSRANFERNRQLFEASLVSQQEYDQTRAIFQANEASMNLKRRELKDTRIRASFSGIVGARSVSPGQVISRNTTLTWLVDLDPVNLEINVPERFLGQLRVGQSLELKVAAFPEIRFQGDVYFIAPFVDPDTRTTLVKARVPNANQSLLPGMFAMLDLALHLRERSVVIPEEAVTKLLDDDWALLFVVTEAKTADLRRVRLGVRMPWLVEVLEGVKEGDLVVVEGAQKIGPDSPVHAVEASAEEALPEPKSAGETL